MLARTVNVSTKMAELRLPKSLVVGLTSVELGLHAARASTKKATAIAALLARKLSVEVEIGFSLGFF